MAPDLARTNMFLGIMAAVSLLQAISIIGILVAGALVVRRVLRLMTVIEQQHVAPTVKRVNAILDDVKEVTSTVREDAGRVDRVIDWLLERVGTHRHVSQSPENRPM